MEILLPLSPSTIPSNIYRIIHIWKSHLPNTYWRRRKRVFLPFFLNSSCSFSFPPFFELFFVCVVVFELAISLCCCSDKNEEEDEEEAGNWFSNFWSSLKIESKSESVQPERKRESGRKIIVEWRKDIRKWWKIFPQAGPFCPKYYSLSQGTKNGWP